LSNFEFTFKYHGQLPPGMSCTYPNLPVLGYSGDQSPD